MLEKSPEVTVVCVLVGLMLIGRGWYALREKVITVKKPIGLPWHYSDVNPEKNPKLFYFTAWGIIVLGVFFLLFPFVVVYVV